MAGQPTWWWNSYLDPGAKVTILAILARLVHGVAGTLRMCVVCAGAPGANNLAADDVVTGLEVARELGLRAIPVPGEDRDCYLG